MIWLSWSSGKDSAYALYHLQKQGKHVDRLVTTINQDADRVAMHATRVPLLKMQADRLSLPIELVEIPQNASNDDYEKAFAKVIRKAEKAGVREFAFGDLFLKDIRAYREKQFMKSSIQPVFPLWGRDTKKLAQEIVNAGFSAYLTCVDPKQIAKEFAGRKYDLRLLRDLPSTADHCGENGEFHSFVYNAPNFSKKIYCEPRDVVERGGFVFADVEPMP